jgi:hypothetical protein
MKRGILILAGLAMLGTSGQAVQNASGDKKVDNRVFEIRTYYANPGKMKALEERFRNHTNKLFEKHGMTIIGFWTPIKGPSTKKPDENKLVYILAFPSVEAAEKGWDAFKNDPDWIAAKKASEVNGVLVARVESEFLKATDYSPIK